MKKQVITRLILVLCLLSGILPQTEAQVLISGSSGTPDNSAMLEIQSDSRGLLIPRMTTAQRALIATPAEGLLVYDTDYDAFFLRGSGKWINLSSSSEIWSQNTTGAYLTDVTTNLAVGTTPISGKKVVIKADAGKAATDPLFEIQDKDGFPIMRVTSEGVRIFIKDVSKGASGGFAVGRYGIAKGLPDTTFFMVSPDSTRIYIDEASSGGFAVGRYGIAKGKKNWFFYTAQDSTRVYAFDNMKGSSGGFAVGRYGIAKGSQDYSFFTTSDSTRVYTSDVGKGASGGFAVGRYGIAKGNTENYMFMVPDNYFLGHFAGEAIQNDPVANDGLYNTFFGYKSGFKTTDGDDNIFIGNQSGYENLLGNYNVFLGNQAGMKNVGVVDGLDTLGSKNVFLGYQSGYNNTSGNDNVLLGYQAGYGVTTAGNNISIGSKSGFRNSNNSSNIFLGLEAGYNHIGTGVANSANNNIYIGLQAGYGPITGGKGINNVFIGTESGKNNDTGSKNVFLGYNAGLSNTEGELNVFLGESAGYSNIGGDYNVFLGFHAGYENESGISNTFLGHGAGINNISGSQNIFIGPVAGMYHQSNSSNVYIGYESGRGTSAGPGGNQNVFVGRESGRSISTGSDNVLLGWQSGYSLTTAGNNISIGSQAGYSNQNNSDNIFIGRQAGYKHLGAGANTAINNIFIGLNAGYGDNPLGNRGNQNIFMGTEAGYSNVGGDYNLFLGYQTGRSNNSGDYNVFLGNQAGYTGTNATRSIYVGYNAGYSAYGSDNVLIGTASGYSNTGDNNIFMGNYSGYNNTGDANIIIGEYAANQKKQGDRGVFIGNYAGYWQEANNNSVFIGDYAGYGTDDGYAFTYPSTNICIGPSSGYTLGDQSSYNVFMGYEAGYNVGTSISGNIIFGAWAGRSIGKTSDFDDYNVIIGYQKGITVEGWNNVLIGSGDYSTTTRNISNSVHIGYEAGDQETTSNKLYIDNSNTTTPLIYGDFNTDALRIHGTLTFNEDPNSIALPNTRGTAGYVLTTDGAGTTSWTSKNSSADNTTASNGLTEVGDDIRLGGALTQNTTITQDGTETLTFTNSGTGNTTFNLSSTGDFNVTHDGTNSAFHIRDDGYIGIGTTSPGQRLDVAGNIELTDALYFTTGNGISLYNANSRKVFDSWWSGSLGTTGLNVGDYTAINSAYDWSGDEPSSIITSDAYPLLVTIGNSGNPGIAYQDVLMTMNNAGNLGIGTTTPLVKIDVRGSAIFGTGITPNTSTDDNIINIMSGSSSNGASNGITFWENTSGFGMGIGYNGLGSGDANKICIYDDVNTELIAFQNGGNVGIGMASPYCKLDVNDVIRAGGNTWPTSGEGLELAYDPSINIGYIQAYDRTASTWGAVHIGGHVNPVNASTFNLGASTNRWNSIYAVNAYYSNRVGIGTNSPVATLDVNGSVAMNIQSVDVNYTITDTDGVYTLLAANTITITLPTVADNIGRIIIIQKNSGNTSTVTIDGEGSELINGASSVTLTNMYTTYTLQSDGTRWRIIGSIL